MKKLLEFQKKVGAIGKDATNPFFKSKYFDINKLIEVIKPILNDVGLVITQPLVNIEGKTALKTVLYDGDTGDELVNSLTPIPEMPKAQEMGSVITYFRRYALQSMLFLQAADDDSSASSGNKPKKPAAPKPPAPTKPKPPTSKDKQKIEVTKLCNKLDLTLKTREDYEAFVKSNTDGLELVEKNYDEIIKRLGLLAEATGMLGGGVVEEPPKNESAAAKAMREAKESV